MCRLGEEYTSCTEQMTGPTGEPFEETWREYGWQGKKKPDMKQVKSLKDAEK